MATSPTRRGRNEPEPPPIIVKKIVLGHSRGHHGGGQWKVAYADFVTAMMAFFLLLWLVSTTDEAKRRGLADYFSPNMIENERRGVGSNGLLGGTALSDQQQSSIAAGIGSAVIAIPQAAAGSVPQRDSDRMNEDRQRFREVERQLRERMSDPEMRDRTTQLRFTETQEGMRIDLMDDADFSMFALGTDRLLPQARALVREVAQVIAGMPNPVIVRGHTDGHGYGRRQPMNNWMLSTARAEATRTALSGAGIAEARFARIEGVADTEPFAAQDPLDPRNRRMSITLAWTSATRPESGNNARAVAPPTTLSSIRPDPARPRS